MMRIINAVDLFCGAGGLTRGLLDAGVNVIAGVDFEKSCRYPYETNNGAKFINKPVQEIKGADLRPFFEGAEYSLLAGCAPCQTFSRANQKSPEEKRRDPKWGLLLQFERLIKETTPDFIAFENVSLLRNQSIFQGFKTRLENDLGYNVWYKVVNCADLGIPQSRKRLILLGSKKGTIALKEPTGERQTVRTTIGDLPKIEAGGVDPADPLHVAQGESPLNLARIRASRPGGTWDDFPEELKSPAMKRNTTFKTRYGRMEWDKPAPTMTTFFYTVGCGRFAHPEQDRSLSLREGALLQTFPRRYRFVPEGVKPAFATVGRMIGNAVPCKLGELIGRSFLESIE